jgi:hypothetical protein
VGSSRWRSRKDARLPLRDGGAESWTVYVGEGVVNDARRVWVILSNGVWREEGIQVGREIVNGILSTIRSASLSLSLPV